MEYRKFIEDVKAEAERLCGKEYEIGIREVVKDNGRTHTGMAFTKKGGKGCHISPLVYLEPYYEKCSAGHMPVGSAAREILDAATGCADLNPFPLSFVSGFRDFENVKGRVNYRLVDYEGNRELLKKAPFVPYCNLAIVFYIYLGENGDGCMTVRIRNEHMEMWKTDTATLYRLAMENTPRMHPPVIRSVGDIMREAAREHKESGFDEGFFGMPGGGEAFPLYVLTNKTGINGASVILYDGVLKGFAEKIGGDLILLPSSIHEMLAIPYEDRFDARNLEEMVRQINRTEVLPEEVLSNSVYRYSRVTDRVSIMSESSLDCGEQETALEIRDGKAMPGYAV